MWIVLAALGPLVGAGAAFAYLRPKSGGSSGSVEALRDLVTKQGVELAALQVTVQGLPSLWEEERDRANKAYARLRAAESSARRRAEEQEAEAAGIPEVDVGGGPEQGVLPMHPSLDATPEADEEEALRRAYDSGAVSLWL